MTKNKTCSPAACRGLKARTHAAVELFRQAILIQHCHRESDEDNTLQTLRPASATKHIAMLAGFGQADADIGLTSRPPESPGSPSIETAGGK